jgi:acetyl esterase
LIACRKARIEDREAVELSVTEPFIRPDVKRFLDYLNNVPGPRMHELQAADARAMMAAMRSIADAPTGDLAVIRDVAISGPHGGDISLRLHDPRETRVPGPVMVFFHGGGFVIDDLDTHEPACAEIARLLDMPVISVDYRLAPENPWPAAPDDCEAAARWVAGSPPELGRKVTGLVLAGDSAGGTLAIVTALALRDAPAGVPLLAQWLIYPAVDLRTRYPSQELFGEGYLLDKDSLLWFNQHYAPDFGHWRASPLNADQTGLPPTLVVTATLDPLLDQGRAYAAACVKAGVPTIYREARGNIHGWLNLRKAIPSSEGDLRGSLAVLRAMIVEAEADHVMAQAAPDPVAGGSAA